jgi:hypothetical protein
MVHACQHSSCGRFRVILSAANDLFTSALIAGLIEEINLPIWKSSPNQSEEHIEPTRDFDLHFGSQLTALHCHSMRSSNGKRLLYFGVGGGTYKARAAGQRSRFRQIAASGVRNSFFPAHCTGAQSAAR